jgi:hypothetical protein
MMMMKLLKRLGHSLNYLFIPSEKNNFKAGFLHPHGLFLLKLGLIGTQLIMQFAIMGPFPKVLGYAASISPDEVIRLTNEKRRENGLPALRKDDTLAVAAMEKGKYMLEKGFWAHVAPDGTEPWYFFLKDGYKYRYAGENLARDFTNPTSAVEAWMASPSHRENMLSDRYRDIGIAVVEGDLAGVDSTIIVQFFGTKLADTLPPEPLAEGDSSAPIAQVSTPLPSSAPQIALAGNTSESPKIPVLISPFVTTKGISLGVVGILLAILVIDEVVTTRLKIKRIGGRAYAHIAYLGTIMIIVLLLKAGKIL